MTQLSSSRGNRWVQGLGVVGLVAGGLLVAGCGSGDDAAVAQGAPTDLSGVTQAWNKNLPAAQRFAVLASFANAAVLDKETGLVWEQSPATTTRTWFDARGGQCTARETGGRKGWRLPSVHELASLVDPSVPPPGPTLPPDHPFTNVQSADYWSATTFASFPDGAWLVFFSNGNVDLNNKTHNGQVWCVRGGMNADAY